MKFASYSSDSYRTLISILVSSGMSFWKAIADSAFDLCPSLCPYYTTLKCRNVIEMALIFQIEAFPPQGDCHLCFHFTIMSVVYFLIDDSVSF